MKFGFGLLIAVAAVFSMASRSDAAIFLSVDLDSGTAGIQSTQSLHIGDTVNASFILGITDPSENLTAYNFSTIYTGLTFAARSEQPFAPGWQEIFTTNTHNANQAFDYDGLTLGTEQAGPYQAQVGTLALTVTQAGVFSVAPGVYDGFLKEGFYNANGDLQNVVFTPGTINVAAAAVPEPASMAVLAVAGVGGLIARRRAARKQAAK